MTSTNPRSLNPGLTFSRNQAQKRELYDKYLGKIDWAYSTSYGASSANQMPVPDLIEIMENDYAVQPVRAQLLFKNPHSVYI